MGNNECDTRKSLHSITRRGSTCYLFMSSVYTAQGCSSSTYYGWLTTIPRPTTSPVFPCHYGLQWPVLRKGASSAKCKDSKNLFGIIRLYICQGRSSRPQTEWCLGRITEVYSESDSIVSVVCVIFLYFGFIYYVILCWMMSYWYLSYLYYYYYYFLMCKIWFTMWSTVIKRRSMEKGDVFQIWKKIVGYTIHYYYYEFKAEYR